MRDHPIPPGPPVPPILIKPTPISTSATYEPTHLVRLCGAVLDLQARVAKLEEGS